MTELARRHAAKRRPDWAALGIAAVLAAIAALIAWDTSRLGVGGAYARIGPQTVPYLICICLGGLSVWTVIEAVRGDFPERERQEFGPVLWIVGGLIAQMVLLRAAGFSIATGVLFAMTARGFGRVNLAIVLPTGIILAGIVWFIFARLLQLSLPAAALEGWIAQIGDALVAGIVAGALFIWSSVQNIWFYARDFIIAFWSRF
jgi:putative tricarboxylic transport membrane protein